MASPAAVTHCAHLLGSVIQVNDAPSGRSPSVRRLTSGRTSSSGSVRPRREGTGRDTGRLRACGRAQPLGEDHAATRLDNHVEIRSTISAVVTT
jgi:hypothetical protein